MASARYALRPLSKLFIKGNVPPSLSGILSHSFTNEKIWQNTISISGPRSFSTVVDRNDIEKRVVSVCKAYDRINADKLSLDSHFKNDLGLDSLDHIEVIMEIENEFGLEIPDVEAEKFMKPSDVVDMLYNRKIRESHLK